MYKHFLVIRESAKKIKLTWSTFVTSEKTHEGAFKIRHFAETFLATLAAFFTKEIKKKLTTIEVKTKYKL